MAIAFTEVSFSCEVSAEENGPLSIAWSGPTADLSPPNTTFQASTSRFLSVLTFNATDSTFEGNYNCTVRYDNCDASVTSAQASFSLIVPPTVTSGPPNVVVGANENVTLSCTSTITGNTSIAWEGPTPNLVGEESVGEEGVTSSLVLSDVNSTNGGVYNCTASNQAGGDSAAGVVFVQPVVDPVRVLGNFFDLTTITCVVQEFPPVNIRWEMKPAGSSVFQPLADETNPGYSFAIRDAGDIYRCVVNTTLFGEINSTTTVVICE